MKLLLCFGTRPEAIKMAPVIHELNRREIEFSICVTGQHREMLDQVLKFFEIRPDYDLNLMQPGQDLNSFSSSLLLELNRVFEEEKPDLVLVQGDTTTAFITSLAAYNKGIKIGHIEAGLRTWELKSPFPEEGNRQLISRIANYHFVPTVSSKNNLLKEAVSEEKIFMTGNTVVDALIMGKVRLENGYTNEEIRKLQVLIKRNKKLILVTGHRREKFGEGLKNVCRALLNIVKRNDVQVIFPVHLNPSVGKTVYELLGSDHRITLIRPVSYPTFIWLMMIADLIISDSGGIQEEAPGLKNSVLVTRDITERPEAVEAGFCILVGTDSHKIEQEANRLLNSSLEHIDKINPFGDGKAAEKIVNELIKRNFDEAGNKKEI